MVSLSLVASEFSFLWSYLMMTPEDSKTPKVPSLSRPASIPTNRESDRFLTGWYSYDLVVVWTNIFFSLLNRLELPCMTRRVPRSSRSWWLRPRRTKWRSTYLWTFSLPKNSMSMQPQAQPLWPMAFLPAGWWENAGFSLQIPKERHSYDGKQPTYPYSCCAK